MAVATEKPPTVSIEEAMYRLNCSRGTVYEAIRRGRVPHVRLGRKIVLPRDRFEKWLAGEEQPTRGAAA